MFWVLQQTYCDAHERLKTASSSIVDISIFPALNILLFDFIVCRFFTVEVCEVHALSDIDSPLTSPKAAPMVPNSKPLADHRAAAKRQAVTAVSAIALVFILWPERFIIWRNLCFVPVAAWLTALVFDIKHGALDAWDGVPAWMKRIIGADDSSSNSSRSSGAAAKSATMPEHVLMHLGDTMALVKKEAARMWEIVRPILAEWIRRVIHFFTSQSSYKIICPCFRRL